MPSKTQETIMSIRTEFESAVERAGTLPNLTIPEDDPVNFVTGRPVVREESQRHALSVAAAAEGYSSNKWATLKQIRANGGVVDKDEFGAPMFMDMGGTLRYYRVYNYDVVRWPDGQPNEFSAPKRKASRKPATKRATSHKATKKASAGTVTITLPNGAVVTCAPADVATIMAAMC